MARRTGSGLPLNWKRIREGLGVPGEEVAAALGWSQPKVSRIENAR
ncbi:helix-turn-helix domain-containing protein, partial [Micromonospora sp. ATA51]|nr:helix-turn-helix domain-containing protein [Micromonospora sp. ATA51]